MKGWKKERQRRQQLRKEARKRKQISHDLNIWYERMKQAPLQTAYHNILLNNTRGDLVKSTKESNPPHQD